MIHRHGQQPEWGLTVEVEGWAEQGRAMRENWDNCNRTIIK